MSELTKFDSYLSGDGPAALVVREWLAPVEGIDGVLFPATFAAGDNFPGGYNIDVYPTDKDIGPSLAAMIKDGKFKPTIDGFPSSKNVCLVDSVGSQANRIEPLFAEEKYKHLVPQIVVKAGDKEVSILEAGHRAGDAIVRCSALQLDLQNAFKGVLMGDAEKLAKIAPTSLVFGVWDSRDTQAKLPRIIASTIRAFDVRKLTRSAQFNPATEFVNEKLLEEPADKATRDAYAERGFIHVPASASHGGVIADGGVRRDASLGLAALRLLRAGKDKEKTLALRRYILGLALVAFTHNPSGYLRQGCLLVIDPSKPREFVEVHPTGDRKPVTVTHEDALKYATAVAAAFGVGQSQTVPFDTERAKKDVKGEGDTKTKGKKGAKKAEGEK
ncbi:CRISPR-associated protein, GSU0053 family OS=Planctomyces limnophilus (strain ATCC 43296 / DSM 3776 / IFAM 1008 / 290) GN=Plim_3149 PE=4 SV=1: Cas_GSU0053 [Gemmata massiliana]|uniref:Type I-U CRISPR-associated protein Cas7 n=1 Tax=Gemmata massiliana TaxID=1210884 RepID=A0A6P2CX74_9BACT|nr:type I-U CRISPR-associated RAMP protein Csb1/Cas7u [Gemmata massiliana]VTR93601.1 CRISPR-associated protein, GSU0053 family OS=Planctomyces limnophilus (strain ATCC 43296 / DSM 3776 / IFAM 1008 / 290) GN=Plim_3149 PE=4 SV=1: Cas_GSU0053 [Gemmata massiliana]